MKFSVLPSSFCIRYCKDHKWPLLASIHRLYEFSVTISLSHSHRSSDDSVGLATFSTVHNVDCDRIWLSNTVLGRVVIGRSLNRMVVLLLPMLGYTRRMTQVLGH